MSWGTILSAVGTAWGIYSGTQESKKQAEYGRNSAEATKAAAEANAKISRYDASVAEANAAAIQQQTEFKVKNQLNTIDQYVSKQRIGFASRGVSVSGGTPLDVQMTTYQRGMEDVQMIKYNGKKAVSAAKDMAKRYRMLADAGLRDAATQASMIEQAWNQKAQNTLYGSVAKGVSNVYSLGQQTGWWK